MRTEDDIKKRLERLRRRYEHKYVEARIGRVPTNCVHNHLHSENKLPYSVSDLEDELELAPRRNRTLLVLDDKPRTVRLCMLGSEDPSTWSMDVCDRAETAEACPHFRLKVPEQDVRDVFAEHMADDGYVATTYPDMAALQWVLRGGPKKWFWPVSLIVAAWRWLRPLPEPPEPAALPEPLEEPKEELDQELKDLWHDPVQDS